MSMKLLMKLLVATIGLASVCSTAGAQTLVWPEVYITGIDVSADGLLNQPAYSDLHRTALSNTLDLAVRNGVPAAGLLRFLDQVERDGLIALELLDQANARMRLADQENPTRAAQSSAMATIRALARAHAEGAPIPESAAMLAAAIEKLETGIAEGGAQSLIDMVRASMTPEEAEGVLGFMEWLDENRDVDLTDAEALEAFFEQVDRLLPASVSGPLSGQIVVFQRYQKWVQELTAVSTDSLESIGETIETGKVDYARLERNAAALQRLRRGPWGAETARDFINRWCQVLPIGADFCTWALEAWDGEAPVDMCEAAIGCDCANSDFAGDIGRNQCIAYEQQARETCRQSGSVLRGFCDPVTSGPAAFP